MGTSIYYVMNTTSLCTGRSLEIVQIFVQSKSIQTGLDTTRGDDLQKETLSHVYVRILVYSLAEN